MNFLSLEYFVVVTEEMNITRAAERLFISQQSLSKHIIKLESELEIKLFVRQPNLELTYAGNQFLKTAIRILDLKRQAMMEIDDINHHVRGELKIGISHTRGRVFLPKVIPGFTASHPFIDVSIKEGNSQELEAMLLHGQIDLLIGFSPVLLDIAETIPILKERLVLVLPDKLLQNKFREKTNEMIERFKTGVNVDLLSDLPFLMVTPGNRVRTLFDSYIKKKKIFINISLEMESIETLLSLSCEGMGLTVYPEMFVKNLSPLLNQNVNSPVHFFPIDDKSTIAQLVVAYHRDRYFSEPMKDFIDICLQIKNDISSELSPCLPNSQY